MNPTMAVASQRLNSRRIHRMRTRNKQREVEFVQDVELMERRASVRWRREAYGLPPMLDLDTMDILMITWAALQTEMEELEACSFKN